MHLGLLAMTRYTEMPFCRLPRATALRLVDQLTAPEQRFARCFHRYWREVMALSEAQAQEATRDELAAAAAMLRAGLAAGDPLFTTIGVTHDLGYEPVGIYAVRPLRGHAVGARLDDALGASRERRGLVHAVAVRDDHAGLTALRTAFVGVARHAVELELDVLYFYSSDHRLAGVYKHFGMDFPDGLAIPGSGHLVGRYQMYRADNRARVSQTAEALGLVELQVAA
jgi:hypothetical protein